MIYWGIIVLGIILLSLSISNPFFNLLIKKYLQFNVFFEILIRILLFFLSIFLIIFGLYIESIV